MSRLRSGAGLFHSPSRSGLAALSAWAHARSAAWRSRPTTVMTRVRRIISPISPISPIGPMRHCTPIREPLWAIMLRSKPRLAPRQAGGRARFAAAIHAPGSPLSVAAVQGERCRVRGEERRLATDGSVVESRRRLEVEGLEKVAPAQADLFLVRADDLLANSRRRSFPRKVRRYHRGARIAEWLVKEILDPRSAGGAHGGRTDGPVR